MKKFILIAITALACVGAYALDLDQGDVVKTLAVATTDTTTNLTADVTYVVPAGERWSLLSVYQDVTTQTNTCLVKRYLNNTTSAEAVTFVTLTAVTNTTAIQNVGEGLGDVTTAPLILTEGDTLWFDASGALSSNVVYKAIIKRTRQ